MVFLLSCSLIARGAALDGVVDQHLTDQAPKRPAVLFRRRLQLAAQRPGNADNDLLVTDCLRHGYPRVIANMHCIVIESDAPREGLISKGRRRAAVSLSKSQPIAAIDQSGTDKEIAPV